MSFCCHGCYKAANAEFKRVEYKRFEIVTPLCQTRRGAGPTPERLYRAAVKRNLGIARELRAQLAAERDLGRKRDAIIARYEHWYSALKASAAARRRPSHEGSFEA